MSLDSLYTFGTNTSATRNTASCTLSGTPSVTTATTALGAYTNALYCTSANQVRFTLGTSNPTSWTIEYWMRTSGTVTNTNDDSSSSSISFQTSNGIDYIVVQGATLSPMLSASTTKYLPQALSGWHHYAIVANSSGNSTKIFQDGLMIAQFTGSTIFTLASYFSIGGASSGTYYNDVIFTNSAKYTTAFGPGVYDGPAVTQMGSVTDVATRGESTGSISATTVTGTSLTYSWTGPTALASTATSKSALGRGLYVLTSTDSSSRIAKCVYSVAEPFEFTSFGTTDDGSICGTAFSTVSGGSPSSLYVCTWTTVTAGTTVAQVAFGAPGSTTSISQPAAAYLLTASNATTITKTFTIAYNPYIGASILNYMSFNDVVTGTGPAATDISNASITLGQTPSYITKSTGVNALVISSGRYATLSNSSQLYLTPAIGTISFGGWFNWSATDVPLISLGASTDPSVLLRYNAGVYTTYVYSSGANIVPSSHTQISSQKLNEWVHVWCVMTATSVSVYENGILTSTITFTSTRPTISSTWRIGSQNFSYYNGTFAGSVCQVKWVYGYKPAPLAISETVSVDPFIVQFAVTDPTKYGFYDGTIAVTNVVSGLPPFTYTWSDTTTTSSSRTGLPSGSYTLTALGYNGVSVTTSVRLAQPNAGLVLTVAPVTINATWSRQKGERSFQISYQKDGDFSETFMTNTSDASTRIIRNLVPDSNYTIRVYSSTTGSPPYALRYTAVGHTQVNSLGNFSKAAFLPLNTTYAPTVYDLKYLSNISTSTVSVASLVTSAFTTGDRVITTAAVGGGSKVITPQVASVNSTVEVKAKGESLYVPFDTAGVTTQNTTITFSDNTSKIITFDKTLNTVSIDGTVYTDGDTLIMNGQRATVCIA